MRVRMLNTAYNRVAGRSVERIAALSDGIFGVAMTLLLLDLRVPAKELIQSEHDLLKAFVALAPQLVVYMMSFMTLGIFWVGQQTELNHLERSDRNLTWINLGFLFLVTIVPFTTRLLAEFTTFRSALAAYWFNIFFLGAALYAAWGYAGCAKLLNADTKPEMIAAVCHRITSAQALYALGALLCIINPYWSIGFIVLVQLNYAIAPLQWIRKSSE